MTNRIASNARFRAWLAGVVLWIALWLPMGAMATDGKVPIRALHFVIRAVSVDDIKGRVDLAASAGYNLLVLALSDGVAFRNFPGQVRSDAWSVDELKDLVAHARARGLAVVPEINFLTHQDKFFQDAYPGLMYNALTPDPRRPDVHLLQRAYLNEVIAAVQPHAIHIGHDEVAGASGWSAKELSKRAQAPLPAELFAHSVSLLHRDLAARGIQLWMWGDMLVAPREFPGMLARHLHGTLPGYGKPLRDRLPKDIVICDWHYFDEQAEFPTVSVLRKEGFLVLGATWKRTETTRNFAAYAAAHGAQGMIATTWFHVQRKEWDVVDRIIRESGAIFAEHFPDQKN